MNARILSDALTEIEADDDPVMVSIDGEWWEVTDIRHDEDRVLLGLSRL